MEERTPDPKPAQRLIRPSGWKGWTVCLAGGTVLAALIALYRYRQDSPDPPALRLWGALCDGTFVTAALLLSFTLLRLIGGAGSFDSLSYGMRGIGQQLFPFLLPKERVTYYEYVQARASRRGGAPAAALFGGLIFLLAAGITMAVYLAGS